MEKVDLFAKHFSTRPYRTYRCPRCKKEKLAPVGDTFESIEPQYSILEHDDDSWDPDWIQNRFSVKYLCTNRICGEVAYATGTGGVQEQQAYDEDGPYWEYGDIFTIKAFCPSPELVQISKSIPDSIKKPLRKSFELYWPSPSAAMSAIRIAIEKLLDELKIPRASVAKNGKAIKLNLHQRLESWQKQSEKSATLCLTLKEVGNLGAHGDEVSARDYCSALEVFSHIIEELYDNKTDRMKKLAAELQAKVKQVKKQAI